MTIVVEAAHQPVVPHVGDAQVVEAGLDRSEEILRRRGQVLVEARRVLDNRPVALVLAVENAERIAMEPVFAVGRQLVQMPFEIGHQCRAIGVAALGIAERVEFQRAPVEHAELLQDLRAKGDHLNVADRIGDAEQLDADLVKLALPAFLRTLIAEHWAVIEEFQRQQVAHLAGDKRAGDGGGAFRAQGDRVAALILERIHLLRHHVGGIAERALEHFGLLKNRRRDLAIAIGVAKRPCGIDHMVMLRRSVGKQIVRAANRL